jgi:PAS domain S-box-containing protein
MILRNLTIRKKLTIIMMFTSLAALIPAGASFITYSYYGHRQETVRDMSSLADVVGRNCQVAVAFDIPEDAEKMLAALAAQPSNASAYIYDKEGKVFAEYHRGESREDLLPLEFDNMPVFKDGFLYIGHDIKLNEDIIGTVYLRDDLRDVNIALRRDLSVLGLVIILALIMAYLISAQLQKLISKPILSLARTAAKVAEHKDYSIRSEKLSQDEVGYLIDSFNDMLTQIQEQDKAIKESEDKYRTLVSHTPAVLWTSDQNGQTSFISSNVEQVYGYTPEEILKAGDRLWFERVHSEDIAGVKVAYMVLMKKGEPFDIEYRIRRRDGVWIWLHDRATRSNKVEGTLRADGVFLDITERKNREKELSEYRNKLRSLVSELTIAEDRERRSIASLLHDDILQKLAFSKMKLAMLRETLTSGDQFETLDNIHEHVSSMFKDMRSLTFDLCPPILYDIGLEAALRDWLQREVADKHGIGVGVETQGEAVQLDEELRVALYRAIREVLINVIKHAQAQNVEVTFVNLEDTVRVEVRDDGIGFDRTRAEKDKESSGGLGLFTVRERLEYFGGSLEIESEPGKGSRVILTAALTNRVGTGKETG